MFVSLLMVMKRVRNPVRRNENALSVASATLFPVNQLFGEDLQVAIMNETPSSLQKTVGHITRMFCMSVLGLFVSQNSKRILILTSLYRELVREDVFREETLNKLNNTLHLSTDIDELVSTPEALDVVWDKERLIPVLTSYDEQRHGGAPTFADLQVVSKKILNMIPPTWRYDTNDGMVKDFITVFFMAPCRSSSGLCALQ